MEPFVSLNVLGSPRVESDFWWLAGAASGWQCGESGIIALVCDKLGISGSVCEFGSGNGTSTGLMCAPLLERGWRTILIEATKDGCQGLRERYSAFENVAVLCKTVGDTPGTNLDSVLSPHGIEPDVVIVDVDGGDYYIVEAMASLPTVLVVEHADEDDPTNTDATPILPERSVCGTVKPGPGGFVHQANGRALDALLKGRMVPVAATRLNTIYVKAGCEDRLRRPNRIVTIGFNDGRGEPHTFGSLNAVEDGSVDSVCIESSLDAQPFDNVIPALKECARVLRPGGRIVVQGLDVDRFIKNRNEMTREKVDLRLVGRSSVFDRERMEMALYAAGFGWLEFVDAPADRPLEMVAMGRKRHWPRVAVPNVCWVMSQGRMAFTAHCVSMIRLAQAMKFSIIPCGDPFWSRGMTRSVQLALRGTPADYLLFTDYDSVFEPSDVAKLIEVMQTDPTAAIVTVPQMSRHNDVPLMFNANLDYSGKTTDLDFSHFGLTLIRREVFEEMPLPWFWEMPGVDIDTGGLGFEYFNHSDSDVTFWRNARAMGFRVVQRNDAVIGHLIEAVKFPCATGTGVLTVPSNLYYDKGRPSNCMPLNPDIYREAAIKRAALERERAGKAEAERNAAVARAGQRWLSGVVSDGVAKEMNGTVLPSVLEAVSGAIPDQHDQG